jgi:putative holliday junction resolvase
MIFFDISEFKSLLKHDYRLLGLDVGRVKVGCALSDPSRTIATGHSVVNLKKQKFKMKDLIEEEKIYGIVVGYPLQMSGEEGDACAMVDRFIKKHLLPLQQPIFLQDERMSTVAVNRVLREMDVNRKKQEDINDKAAAGYILQTALYKLAI